MFLPANTYLFIASFSRQANSYAAMYGGPVYLVGSALYKEDAADFDVRIPLIDEDIVRRYGAQEVLDWNFTWDQDWRIYYDELKQSRRLARFGHPRVDFQLKRAEIFYQHGGDKLRLDSAPDGFFHAGLGNP